MEGLIITAYAVAKLNSDLNKYLEIQCEYSKNAETSNAEWKEILDGYRPYYKYLGIEIPSEFQDFDFEKYWENMYVIRTRQLVS